MRSKKLIFQKRKRSQQENMDTKEFKEVIEWCDEKGHSEHEIVD